MLPHDKILKEYNQAQKTYLAEDETETGGIVKLLCCDIDDYEYSLNVNWVPEDKLDWLANVYSRHLTELKNRTDKKVRKEIGDKFNDFLNAIGKI